MIAIIVPTCLADMQGLFDMFSSLIKVTHEEYHLIFIKNELRGFANAVNQGLEIVNRSNYEGAILLNDDIVISTKDWMEKLIKDKDKYDIIGCRPSSTDTHVAFYCTYISKKVIDTIGFLDQRFQIGECEDVDYCRRAIDAGFKIGVSECEVFHRINGTIGRLNAKAQKIVQKNKQLLKEKYKGTKWEE